MESKQSPHQRNRLGVQLGSLPWLVLVTGLCITGLWSHQQRSYRQLEHERVERDLAGAISQALTSRLQSNIGVLDAVVGLFDASSCSDQGGVS